MYLGASSFWRQSVLGGPALDLNLSLLGALPSAITFARASTAWYFNSAGVLTSASSNVARFDYNPATLAAKGFLREEARTNLLLNSTTLATQSATVTNVAHTLSFYGTGTVTLTGVSTAGPLVGTGATSRVSLTFTPTAGSLTLTVTGSVTMANLEIGTFATSPIITVGSQVTRAAETAYILIGAIPGYDATQGTMAMDYTQLGAHASTTGALIGIDDGTTANRIHVRRLSTATPSLLVATASVTNINAGLTTNLTAALTLNTPHKLALAYGTNDAYVYLDGLSGTAAGTFTAPTMTRIAIGSGSSLIDLSANITRIRVWNSRRPNAELQTITV